MFTVIVLRKSMINKNNYNTLYVQVHRGKSIYKLDKINFNKSLV